MRGGRRVSLAYMYINRKGGWGLPGELAPQFYVLECLEHGTGKLRKVVSIRME